MKEFFPCKENAAIINFKENIRTSVFLAGSFGTMSTK
jgi:hypothetical protein